MIKFVTRFTYFPKIMFLKDGKPCIDNSQKLIDSVWLPGNTLRKVFDIIK